MRVGNIPSLAKDIKREDLWIVPFTAMAIILAGYSATANKASVWLFSGLLILGMLVFSSVLIAHKYSKARSRIHITWGLILVVVAIGAVFVLQRIA